jgi:superkiller protein 3
MHEEAIQSYEMAIALEPDYPQAWSSKGNRLSDLDRPEEALQAYDRAIELDPNYAEAWHNKGNHLRRLGRYEEALQACDRAIGLAWKNWAGTRKP